LVALFDFRLVAAALENQCIEVAGVREFRLEKVAEPECPLLLIEIDRHSIGVSLLVRRVIVSSTFPNRPIHKIVAGVVGISVVVEKVVYRQFSGINRQAGEILRTGDLVEAVGDELLLATESYRLLQIEPRYIES